MHVGKNVLLYGAVIIYGFFGVSHGFRREPGERGGRLLYQEGELREN